MFNGFNILICGSSRITETHIKVLKKIKFCKIKYIFGEDKKKIYEISKKYELETLENLNLDKLKECNLAVITSATYKHYNLIKKLSKIIHNFIVEKPIVANLKELQDLKKLNNENEINLFEVSQNIFYSKIKKYINKTNKLVIIINKNRQIKSYYNFKNQIEKSKSPIMAQIPHWYDLSTCLLGKPLFLEKVLKKK
jgi:predicted dehydrogenase